MNVKSMRRSTMIQNTAPITQANMKRTMEELRVIQKACRNYDMNMMHIY